MMKLKALSALGAAMALIVVGAGVATGHDSRPRVRVEPVERERVERLLSWSISAAVPGNIVAPATCAADPEGHGRVWFMPVFINQGTAEVSCSVPARSVLVLNLGGTLCPEDDATPRNALVQCAIQYETEAPGLQTAIVDGIGTDEFASEPTGVFDVSLPADNIFGQPAGRRGFAYDGRNLMIKGLGKGGHTIRLLYQLPTIFGGPFDVDITYHVTVG
jgi:hypothetical protein